jgi:hypothetical protein
MYTLKNVITNKIQGLVNNSKMKKELENSITKGKLKINKAFAGVGKPINESVWRVSILKLARR